MEQGGYSKLEKRGNKLNLEEITKLADAMEMDPMDILTFDEKNVLNIGKQKNGNYSGGYVVNHFSTAMQEDYEKRIKQLEEDVKWLNDKIKPLLTEAKPC